MTTAQQTADSEPPRDLTDAAAKREEAKAYIEDFMRENAGALPSGAMVGDELGMTGKWGQNQLKPFRPDSTPGDGTPPRRPGRTVGDLVAERSGGTDDPSPATLVIGTGGPERPATRSGERPVERSAPAEPARPERSAAATGTTAGTPTGTTRGRSGTPAAEAPGSLRWNTVWRKVCDLAALLPLLAIAAGAFVSIWGGWVGLGKLTGFGKVELLPGWMFDTAFTLPLGMEAYAAYALKVWLAPPANLSPEGRDFARRSAIGALVLGAAGQVAYHLMAAAKVADAPWWITMLVACFPVGVMGCAAALSHYVRHPEGRS